MPGEYLEPLSSRVLAHGFLPDGRGAHYSVSERGARALWRRARQFDSRAVNLPRPSWRSQYLPLRPRGASRCKLSPA